MTLPRFYPILDSAALAARRCPLEIVAGVIIEAGARILQLRHKFNFDADTFEHATAVAAICKSHNVLFVVNDRCDIAALLDAGVHLGQDDIPPRDARKLIGSERVLGFSTHNETQLTASNDEPVDYIALGPIFATASKANPDPVVGLRELARLRPLTSRPLVAIGGIDLSNAPSVLQAGADSVAVIADLLPDPCNKATLRARAEEWIRITNGSKP